MAYCAYSILSGAFIKYKVPYKQSVITLQTAKAEKRARTEGLTEEEIRKKSSTMLSIHDLYKMKQIEDSKDSITAIIGGKNIVSFVFPGQVRDLHEGTINI